MRIATSLFALSAAFVSTTVLASKPTIQRISGAYGSVEYAASVRCEAAGSRAYAFTVSDLVLTFRPDARFNTVEIIRAPRLRLRTTVLQPGAVRAVLTSNSSVPLNLTLDKRHRTAKVSKLRFVVSEQKVRQSTSTILDLTDSHLVWPFPSNLKSCALSSNSSFDAEGAAAAQPQR